MPGTLAVRSVIGGRTFLFGGLDDTEAAGALCEALAVPGASAEVADLLPPLREGFPPGAMVRLGPRVCWRRGARGIVTEDIPESHARWPREGTSPWFISHDGASVSVRLDGDTCSSWWPAHWLERS